MKKIFAITIIIAIAPIITSASTTLATRLSGKILIRTDFYGEAWYVNPGNYKRYFLGRPNDAFNLMKKLGIGISNKDLDRIDYDIAFAKKNSGKIFIQTEKNGEAWYINPDNQKKYFLNRPIDAFNIMRNLGLGINDKNIDLITVGQLYELNNIQNQPTTNTNNIEAITFAAQAFRDGNKNEAIKYFIPEMKKAIEYSMDNLSSESLLTLGNILSGSRLESATDIKKVYSNEVYFNGQKIPAHFNVEKINGQWLITNL